ncbi:hypothetical protein D3C75_1130000 [compost metagenome]
MFYDLKLFRCIRKRHWTEMNRIRLLALKTNHMMMVVSVTITADSEFETILKHNLLKNTQLFHDSEITVYRIKAQAAILLTHIIIYIFRG